MKKLLEVASQSARKMTSLVPHTGTIRVRVKALTQRNSLLRFQQRPRSYNWRRDILNLEEEKKRIIDQISTNKQRLKEIRQLLKLNEKEMSEISEEIKKKEGSQTQENKDPHLIDFVEKLKKAKQKNQKFSLFIKNEISQIETRQKELNDWLTSLPQHPPEPIRPIYSQQQISTQQRESDRGESKKAQFLEKSQTWSQYIKENKFNFFKWLVGASFTFCLQYYFRNEYQFWMFYLQCQDSMYTKVNQADMRIPSLDLNNPDFLRVEKFILNSTWHLNQRLTREMNKILERLEKLQPMKVNYFKRRSSLSGEYGIYFYGDPGIGKSTAFATIVYLLTHQDRKVRKYFKKVLPFFQNGKYINKSNYIYIDEQILNRSSQKELKMIARRLISRHYVVIIDDIHAVLKDIMIRKHFIKPLKKRCKKLIFLSSQGYAKDPFKNTYSTNILVEVPQTEAVKQIADIISVSKGGKQIPNKMREFFAYRLWFYTGGNFRNIKKIMGMQYPTWELYMSKFFFKNS